MNCEAYIASGILESYALGIVTPQERQEVECMARIYPEIKRELDKVLYDVEALAQLHAVTPPDDVKQKVLAAIKKEPVSHAKEKVTAKPSRGIPSLVRLAAAACLIFGIIMGALYFTNKDAERVRTYKAVLARAKDELRKKENLIATLQESKKYTEREIAMFRDPDSKTVYLQGTNNNPKELLAIVCCNEKKEKTVIAIDNLPSIATNKQYQIWAIVSGKPVSVGLIPTDTVTNKFFEIQNINTAQAYAITIEDMGGSIAPTLEQMVVMGTVNP